MTWFQVQLQGPLIICRQAGRPPWLHFPEDFWAALSLQLAIMSASPGGQRDTGPAVHLGVWQEPVDSFMMLFKNELPPVDITFGSVILQKLKCGKEKLKEALIKLYLRHCTYPLLHTLCLLLALSAMAVA